MGTMPWDRFGDFGKLLVAGASSPMLMLISMLVGWRVTLWDCFILQYMNNLLRCDAHDCRKNSKNLWD